jgi:tetratricopeptide (TPR) repeat protein
MIKFLTKIKLAIAFQASLNYDAKHQYQKIINTLEKYRPFVDGELSNPFSEYFILLGEAYYKITNYRIAEGYFLNALEHIDNEAKFNEDEKNYLKYITYYWLCLVYKDLYEDIKVKQCLNLLKKITFDENNIKRYIKNNFPLNN